MCVACTHACMQEAFLAAATSTQPADAAALQALQSSFPTAGFDLRVRQPRNHATEHTLMQPTGMGRVTLIPALLPCQDGTLVRSAFDEHERALLDDVLRLLVVRVAADAVSSGQPIMQYTRQGQAQGELSLMQRLLAMIKWMAQASVVPEEGDKAKGAATDKAQGGRAGGAQGSPPLACCLLFVRRGLGSTRGIGWGQEGAHVDTIKGGALSSFFLCRGFGTMAAAAAAAAVFHPWLCCVPPAPSPRLLPCA